MAKGMGFVSRGGGGAGCEKGRLANTYCRRRRITGSLWSDRMATAVGLASTYVHLSIRIGGVLGRSQLIAGLRGTGLDTGNQRVDYEYYQSLNSIEAIGSLLCMN
jgi:hypothetical protein